MEELRRLLQQTAERTMTPEEKEAQRQSFAFGNASFENPDITRETVARASEHLKAAGISPADK